MERKIVCIIFSFVVILLCLMFVVIMSNSYYKGVERFAYHITLDSSKINFSGTVSDVVDIEDIESLTLMKESIEGGKYGAGEQTNEYLNGDAIIDEIGKCRAYVYFDVHSYILLKSDKVYVFNLEDEEKTEELYHELNEMIYSY